MKYQLCACCKKATRIKGMSYCINCREHITDVILDTHHQAYIKGFEEGQRQDNSTVLDVMKKLPRTYARKFFNLLPKSWRDTMKDDFEYFEKRIR